MLRLVVLCCKFAFEDPIRVQLDYSVMHAMAIASEYCHYFAMTSL